MVASNKGATFNERQILLDIRYMNIKVRVEKICEFLEPLKATGGCHW